LIKSREDLEPIFADFEEGHAGNRWPRLVKILLLVYFKLLKKRERAQGNGQRAGRIGQRIFKEAIAA